MVVVIRMRDLELYTTVLGITSPWKITDATIDAGEQCVEVVVKHEGPAVCPVCGKPASKYDTRPRRWRHLDFCQYRLFITAEVPRVDCQTDGVKQINVPWAEERSGFTALFEQCVIAWLRELSFEAVVRRMRISWDEIDGIMTRAVARGLRRRQGRIVRYIGIDEKSIRKRHKYFTIVSDLENQEVLWIGHGRKRETIDAFWRTLTPEQLAGIEGIAMDMWAPYYDSAVANVPDGKSKIVFDKFHIAKYLSEALDKTRKRMSADPSVDRRDLKGRRWLLLRNPHNMSHAQKLESRSLRAQYAELGRGWSLVQAFKELWEFRSETWALKHFKQWYFWATHSRLEPFIKLAKMLKRHLENILTYLRIPITNAAAEGLNSKIQLIKYRARGYRNADRFERAIYFHCGGLDLSPTHTKV
jgi:transposase